MVTPSEKTIKDMAEMLLKGAKMLPYHCDECMSPLFEKNGVVMCPVHGELEAGKKKEGKKKPKVDERTREILAKKKNDLLKRLEAEEKPEEISAILDALAKIEEMLG